MRARGALLAGALAAAWRGRADAAAAAAPRPNIVFILTDDQSLAMDPAGNPLGRHACSTAVGRSAIQPPRSAHSLWSITNENT